MLNTFSQLFNEMGRCRLFGIGFLTVAVQNWPGRDRETIPLFKFYCFVKKKSLNYKYILSLIWGCLMHFNLL